MGRAGRGQGRGPSAWVMARVLCDSQLCWALLEWCMWRRHARSRRKFSALPISLRSRRCWRSTCRCRGSGWAGVQRVRARVSLPYFALSVFQKRFFPKHSQRAIHNKERLKKKVGSESKIAEKPGENWNRIFENCIVRKVPVAQPRLSMAVGGGQGSAAERVISLSEP